MPEKNNDNMNPNDRSSLIVKLLALYDINRSYIDEAEKFLCSSTQKMTAQSGKQSIGHEDIDRLYSHVAVLEHIAKLLHEEFLINKNERASECPGNNESRLNARNHE
jgi:hypothetical protein